MEWFASGIDFYSRFVGPILGLILSVPVVWTWVVVAFGKRRRYKKWSEAHRRDIGSRPVILGVDALPTQNMKAAVLCFLEDDQRLNVIPEERRFWVVRKKNLSPENMYEYRMSIRDKIDEIADTGADTIHLFYAGPVVGMGIIGAELSNSCRVLVYHHEKGKKERYVNMGPLDAREVMGS